ncbi:MAG: OadG family protein [Clostridia bacterium]|jgi:Na+-transporting methylmalonyl-CoA/oxaloacetate decarboxylase gamma subunit|nr:OadG family protein [Clostridia bacterium]MCI2000869.1 OadG family protein [Clostridia bacterium]MCI2015339.1 OadG family protein [Clostridia bacterium]
MGFMRISAFDAFIIALSGFAVVFAVLAIIYIIIILISKILAASGNKTGDKQEFKTDKPSENKDISYGGEVALIGVDEKTAACIMAIVSHETGIPLSELVFKKIKAI